MNENTMTEADCVELRRLNEEVGVAIARRREWLDKKMAEYATVPIGEKIYDLDTGRLLGVVVGHYRFWRDRDEGVRDDNLSIDYEYRDRSGNLDNTSRLSLWVGGKAERDETQLEDRLMEDTPC